MKKVCIINPSFSYADMFKSTGWEVVATIEEADLVQFTGGEDVTPALYGEGQHPKTFSNLRRDAYESQVFKECVLAGKNMAGICRGGQFLNVKNGGKMWQDVSGHAIGHTHGVFDVVTNEFVRVTSTHHQMMRIGEDGALIAWAKECDRRESVDEEGVQFTLEGYQEKDAEVIFYAKTNSLCFQPHPEFHGADSTRLYYFTLLNHFFGY